MHEKGSSAQEQIHSQEYLQNGNTGCDNYQSNYDEDQRISTKECIKKVKLNNNNNNVSEKRY